MKRRAAGWVALLAVAAWLGLAYLLALTGCSPGSTHAPVAEPPTPPVVEPPSQPPPRPVVVSDVRVTVTLAGYPMRYVRVSLGAGIDAPTDGEGVARFRALDAGAYAVAVRDAPPLAVQVLEPVIYVAADARAFAVELVADIGDGQLVLLGDSDSSDPSDFRSSSVDDHLADVAALAGWPEYRHSNRAQSCTSAAPTGCERRAIEQVRDLPHDAAIVVLRWGLNDLHYEIGPETFAGHYADALDEVIARGAVPVVVAIQAEEEPAYRGRRDAYNRDLAALAAGRSAIYVDPGISWASDRELFADDGVHLDDDGTRAVAAAVLDGLRQALTTGTLDLAPPEPVRPCDARFGEAYGLGVSYYGLLAATRDVIEDDLSWLASIGVCGPVRVWADWLWDGRTDGAMYRPDGSVRGAQAATLDFALGVAGDFGVQLDLTLGDSFDSCEARAIALRDLAARTRGSDAVAYIDGWNEADSALTRDCARRIHDAVRAGDPERLLTISLSAGASGDPDTITDGYREIADLVDFTAPHFPRKDGWWERAVPLALALQDATGLRAHLQEEAREAYQGAHWPLDAYVSVERYACAAGLLGYVQHTEAGFSPWLGTLREQLDPTTRAALEAQGAAGCPS